MLGIGSVDPAATHWGPTWQKTE